MGEVEAQPFGETRGTAPPAPRSGNGPDGRTGGGLRACRSSACGSARRRNASYSANTSVDVGRAHAALVAVHQRVVGIETERRRQRRRSLAHQAHDLLEVRPHQREVGLAACLAPYLLAGRIGAGLRLDQIGRHRRGADIGVAHQAEIGRAPWICLAGSFRGGEIVADDRRHQQRVRQAGQHGKLIAARGAAARRHHRGGIPVQHRGRLAQRRDAGEAVGEPVVGIHSFSTFLAQSTKITTRAMARPYQVIA